ncbi:uncharacterized protein LOC135835533 [Planococcus citri]|uniref:uncharacterized protein LOC135835533 n=1 Tax=Planococcus citri TaxID=170843 RepID=UPI0031F98C84
MATSKNFKLCVNYLCPIIWLFCGFILVDSNEQALIFNADFQIFDNKPTEGPLCFTACPAKSDEEIKFNKTKSLAKNSLFLKNVLNPFLEYDKLLTKCEYPYKPSMLFRKYSEEFEIGYEIYFDGELHKKKGLLIYTKDQFSSVEKAKENYKPKSPRKRIIRKSTRLLRKRSGSPDGTKSGSDSENEKEVQPQSGPDETMKDTNAATGSESATKEVAAEADNTKNEEKSETEKDWEKSLAIYWLRIFNFIFDIERFGPTEFEYSVDVGIDTNNADYQCPGYEVDKVLYEDVDFTSIYEKKNQAGILSGLSPFSKSTDIDRCGNQYGCFKQHQVIPHYYYHTRASKDATCFAVNTLPVWESISDGFLKKVDRYLYEISQVLDSKVTITTSTINVLSYRAHVRQREIYMDFEKKRVPAPKIIYNVLEQVKNGEKYNLIVVTHNDPVPPTQIQRICPPEASDKIHYEKVNSSWEFLVNENPETGITYPCPWVPAALDNLGISFSRSEIGILFMKTLYLNGDVTQKIKQKVDNFFKESEKK